jgi:predicted tellurium resistance membrane protein TerC
MFELLDFSLLASSAAAPTTGEIPPLFSGASAIALVTLTLMEIVLGIDNVVFVSILVAKLPKDQQKLGRNVGMGLALLLRLGLLFGAKTIMGLTEPVFTIPEWMRPDNWSEVGHLKTGLSWRDLILLGGGVFLIYKATTEIFEKLEGAHHHADGTIGPKQMAFGTAIFQLILLDLVFSLDSVITAVGMVPHIEIMVVAMFVAVGTMIAVAGAIGEFVDRHPSVKILALSFLNLIGVMLLLEGTGQHVNKGYIYSAMAFSLLVELLNMRLRKVAPPVVLHEPKVGDSGRIPASEPASKI